ncbi:15216_t:CDS:10 [Entrophospora sp. SA101]|nr:15216_t:CDS:10 [Entrophospora sp. SA101]CAJ0868384.1 4774_t:CDS:10 [Entrophospora sp. SA101]CAJ0925445.1 11567_t:CDS:10 [Entrophospora sp. SA101]
MDDLQLDSVYNITQKEIGFKDLTQGPIPRVDNYDVIRAKFIVDSLDHKMMTTFSKNANEFRDEGRVRPNNVSKDDLDVIGIDLSPIKTKKREKVLETIHNIYQAERIDNILFIKFDGFVKGETHMALLYSLDQQLTWDFLIDTISVVNGNEFRPDIGGWRQRPTRNLGAIGECPQKQEVDLADVRTFEITIANTNSRIVITIYAQTYTTYFFNRGEKMLKASAILKNELLQDNYRCSHGNKIGLVISIADIKIRKCDHGNHKFYAYSMCMLFSAIYYFKLEFKFEYPITMRTLSEIWTKFMENEEIMTYIDSEEGEENDGAISVDMVNQSPRKFIILLEKHLV